MGYESIAHEAEGRMGYWFVALEGEGSNCFSITQPVGQKKAIITLAKLMQVEEIVFRGKNQRKTGDFRYSMTIIIRPLVA